jgi:hypothetical protein
MSGDDFLIHVDKGNLEAATVARIMDTWKRIFRMTLNRERVANHLRSLREWRDSLGGKHRRAQRKRG